MDALYWVPRDRISDEVLSSLTFTSRFPPRGPKVFDELSGKWEVTYLPPVPIETFSIVGDMVGLPRRAGLVRFGRPDEVAVSYGQEIEPFPRTPSPRDETQAAFWDAVSKEVHRTTDVFAAATTGSGKTVCCLKVASQLLRKTIVVVHMGSLMTQWVEAVRTHLGIEAGTIGDGTFDDTKPITIAMLQTLRSREFPPEWWAQFGFGVIDEGHRVDAEVSSEILKDMSSARRLIVSATPTRKDGLHEVAFAHLGEPRVVSTQEVMPIQVHVLRHRLGQDFSSEQRNEMLAAMCADEKRNAKVVRAVRGMLAKGRRGIVVSDRVDHLDHLMRLCRKDGIPVDDMGLFAAQRVVNDEHGEPVYKATATGRRSRNTKRKPIKEAELEVVKNDAKVVFATYQKILEAIDQPTWSAGIDATPRSEAIQLLGRIRRLPTAACPDKPQPLWVTFLDEDCRAAKGQFWQRMRDYEAVGAKVTGI